MSGYRDRAYVDSLRSFGTPLHLSRSGGWLLERPIGKTGLKDAIGPYPLFDCANWQELAADFDDLTDRIVSVCVVADPLADGATAELLKAAFRDLVRPFKTHFVRDLSLPVSPSAHHQRNVRLALEKVEVERCAEPLTHLAEWLSLYAALTERHAIEGIAAFSATSFEAQLGVPGIEVFRARRAGVTVGMTLWYRTGRRAHYHLGAYSVDGYACRASYAVFQVAFEYLQATGVQVATLGGGAGLREDPASGLVRFKKGWATGERSACLCGRILDQVAYARLSAERGATGYFPAYRGRMEAGAT
jgi:hypothetical protein